MIDGDTAQAKVDKLVEALKNDGFDFTVGIDIDTPIALADRVVSAGKGIGDKKNMKLIEELHKSNGNAGFLLNLLVRFGLEKG